MHVISKLVLFPSWEEHKLAIVMILKELLFACFGMSSYLCAHVWDEIDDALPSRVLISHYLWALLFLKVYGMDDTMAVMLKTM